jgi:hypothetical protein
MNIKHLDVEQIVSILTQKGYSREDMLEILSRCDSLVKMRFGLFSEAEVVEDKVELIKEREK